MANRQIDPDKLRAAVRRLGDEYVFHMLNEAIDLLPQAKLLKLLKRYIDPSKLKPDGKDRGNLLSDVKAFQKASLAGEYQHFVFLSSSFHLHLQGPGKLLRTAEVFGVGPALVQSSEESEKAIRVELRRLRR